MHIMQHQPSSEIVKNGRVDFTKIYSDEGLYRRFHLTLKNDPRVDGLVKQLQKEIKAHHWHPERNEKEICIRAVQLIHSNGFFGPYNKKILAALETDSKDFGQLGWENNRITDLKDFKKGELICMQEAAIASYVLHNVGIANDYCSGYGKNGSTLNGHCFVQTRSGNIVEASRPETPYAKNLNHGLIAKGQIVIARYESNGHYVAYGAGDIPGLKAIAYTISPNKLQIVKKTIAEHTQEEGTKLIASNPEFAKAVELAAKSAEEMKRHGADLKDDKDGDIRWLANLKTPANKIVAKN